jgi:renin receptor
LLQIDGSHASADGFISEASSSFKTRIESDHIAAPGLTDKDELIVIHSDESLDFSGSGYLDNEFSNLANWLEGSYQKSSGKLVIPLESGNSLTLLLDKEADLEFTTNLVSLLKTVERGIQVHKDFSAVISPAELLVCHFAGMKALEDEYGSKETVRQGTEVVQRAFAKAFESLQGAYKGRIVGLVISTNEASVSLESVIGASSSLHISRQLEEASQTNATEASVLLVRKSLAWITGIILFVSTLIGICLLMNMPFTRDTLLYSNVKID